MLTVDFRRLPLQEKDLVLDAGCGEGRHTFHCFRSNCSILGMDLDKKSLLKARWVLGEMKKTQGWERPGPFPERGCFAVSFPNRNV